MANMVTRTIKTTTVNVVGVDLTNNTIVDYEEILPRTYKDEAAILKELEKRFKNSENDVKPVAIKGFTVNDTLYGMSEDDFMKNAVILPPRKVNDNSVEQN